MIGIVLGAAFWVGTWGSAPVRADDSQAFQGDTLREVVHVSAGGSQVRVRFTNRFGDAPVVIADAAVAVQQSGAVPVPGTIHKLTFMGKNSATIPPHADLYSDPVSQRVAPQSNLLVDLYLPGPTGPPTQHLLAYQTNYYAIGDRAGESSAQMFGYTYDSWYFLAAVDVAGTPARGAVVALGDSITDGAGGKKNANDRWPDFLAARILSESPRQFGVLNEGISGNRILLGARDFGPDALARFDADVLSQSGATDVMVQLGINDIQQSPHQYDATRIEQGLQQIVFQAHARGLRVIACTITPYEGWLTYDASGEATRTAVNEFIRRSGSFDAVVDFDAAVRDPNDLHRLLRAYDSGDHLHPNAAGHRAMVNAVNLASF
ncbi:MAG TPA: SGNH/GDSL hydrolase family protein [Candidatus Baltobacteraceae bacterium]|nr:SGNH/GDSL hydrolase family protein [Candidatus Baltobacteraceae bacterium]